MPRANRHYIPGHLWHTPVKQTLCLTGQVTSRCHKRRDVVKSAEGYHLRKQPARYMALSEAEKDDLGAKNTYC